MDPEASASTQVVVVDFANIRSTLDQLLVGGSPKLVEWVHPAVLDEFRIRLNGEPRPDVAIVSLDDPQSAWLLRTLQVNRYLILMKEVRRPTDPIHDIFGVFLVLADFCKKGGCGVVVADIPRSRDLDAYSDEIHLGLGPIAKEFESMRLAFVARDGIESVPFALLEPSSRFGFIYNRSGPAASKLPCEWVGLDFSLGREQELRVRREFADESARTEFLRLCSRVFEGKKDAMLHTLHALRLCRRMVNWNLEGSPFRCTIFLGDQNAYDQKTAGTFNEMAAIFAPKHPIPFDFDHLSDVRDLAEMIQSDGLVLFINVDDGRIHNISGHESDSEAGEHYWQEKYAALTHNNNCLVIHMHGGHLVELYGENKLRLWFDGHAWQLSPYRDIDRACSEHFQDPEFSNPRTRRLMQVILALLDEQKSSILLLLNKQDEEGFRKILKGKKLYPLRPKIDAGDFKSAIDRLPMSALVGILKLDGSHVIDQQGKLRCVAHKIGDKLAHPQPSSKAARTADNPDNEGTGTRAARNLSKSLPHSFVVKVSASGTIKILQAGNRFPPHDG